MQQPTPQLNALDRMRSTANGLMLVCRALAVTAEVFLHRRMGERSIGLRGLLGAFAIPLFSLGFPHEDCRPLLWFLAAFLAACLWARASMLVRSLRRDRVHSFYTGEPRIVLEVGLLVIGASVPLGCYLLVAAAALFVSTNADAMHERARARDLFDASIDQHGLAEQFRDMRGGR